MKEIYAELSKEFPKTRTRSGGGGIQLEYIDGEQCITRLNETLGFMNWDFRILDHGIHEQADECWVLGEMRVTLDGATRTIQNFGSQKIKRPRGGGNPMDIGFDLKGAATDSVKKCATFFGIALYLYNHDEPTVEDTLPKNCEKCNADLKPVQFPNGTAWTAGELAQQSQAKTGGVYCFDHMREEVEQRRAAAKQ